MRPPMSLEEEKRLLLEQLESSRAVYRRMLMNAEEPAYDEVAPEDYHYAPPVQQGSFPQSQTMRWIRDHPYLLTAGVIALLVAGKKGWARSRSKPETVPEKESDDNIKKGLAATTLGTTLATTLAMMLRNPAQMRAAMRAVTIAMNYYKSRRGNPRTRFE